MQLPGRLAAAIDVLADIGQRNRPASDCLRDWGLSHRFAGAGDRAAIGNLVYDSLRRRASHAFSMGEDTPRALVLSVAVREWGEDPANLNALFGADKFAPAALSDTELAKLTANDPLAGAPDHVRADIPDWLAPDFETTFGDKWVAEGQAFAARPPLDMRVNTLKSDRDRVLKSLKRFSPLPTDIAPSGIRIPTGGRNARTPNVQTDEAYLKGWFEIQDEGSQIASLIAGATPGEQVLDYCAGAGGKTLAMAAQMQNKGQIYAYDTDRGRLAPIYDRLKRAGARNVQVRPPEPDALNDLTGRLDRVLVDAPCTGTGTWRRRPDAKWRLSADQLALRVAEQSQILAKAGAFVKPGGTLVYVTCSVLPQENQAQIAGFLEGNAQFEVRDMAEVWRDVVSPDHQSKCHIDGLGIVLSPAASNTDGFFVSALTRKG